MTLWLTTLGGLRAVDDAGALDRLRGQRLRAALLVYLAVERRVSRETLAAVFWPESTSENARHALRQSLYQLRKGLGPDWLEAGPHELRTSARVRTDVGAFVAALERRDVEAAARLYAGPFLDGVNLLDVKAWESWVDGRRSFYGREFRRACREWLEARRAAGDLAGAVEAAQRWVAPDPFDDEAQHRLIDALASAGERADAIRQFETYARLLEPDGLRPLDQTVELIERVRSASPPWPSAPPMASTSAPLSEPPPAAPLSEAPPPLPRVRAAPLRRLHALAVAGIGGLVVLGGAYWFVGADRVPSPRGSLVAAGAIAQGERIVLADFGGPQSDPGLGAVVTDALRIDLVETDVLRVLERSEVREILERMQLQDDVPLTAELAREVALREGVKAVLEGEVAQAGSGYVLTAGIRSAGSDRILAAFRETARTPEDVIPAIDRLSRQIRKRLGESLRSIDEAAGLARVTTGSLGALRVYSEADRAFQRRDYTRVVALLEEALDLDPEFAMAWRLLAVTLGNTQWDRVREVEAFTRAYELRGRSSPRERHLAAAGYFSTVESDYDAAIEAYRRVLDLHPDDRAALNNLGLLYRNSGDLDAAADLFEQASRRAAPSAVVSMNLVHTRLAQGRLEQALATANEMSSRYPDDLASAEARFWVLLYQGDPAAARADIERFLDAPGRSQRDLAFARDRLARVALWQGRMREAREHLEAAELVALDAGPPHNPFAWRINRAHAEAAVGDADRAVELLLDGIRQGLPDDVEPADQRHGLQANVFGLAGRPDHIEATLARFEADVPIQLQRSYLGRTESALALVQLHRGNPAEAVRLLERARTSQSCRFCFAREMGWALLEAGRLREAAREWEDAIAGKDGSLDIGLQLAEELWILQRLPSLYEALGDTAMAMHHYRSLIGRWGERRRRAAASRTTGSCTHRGAAEPLVTSRPLSRETRFP
jgi:DNA-binding SARP family transcriptional activator/TolB-like protein